MSKTLNKIFLDDLHRNNGAKFIPFADYSMPINYPEGIIKEHLHTRKSIGVFDVSHMGQILIPVKKNNILSLNKYIPLDFDNMLINKSHYSFILNINGGIIDDIIVSKINFKKNPYFYIVYNAGRKKVDEKIFNSILTEHSFLKNNSLISIQGPLSSNIIKSLKINNDIFFMEIKTIIYKNEEIIISRSGYTGEDGFELSIPNNIVEDFMNNLLQYPQVLLCGLGSRDSLRLEAGLSLYGNELNESTTPIEAGLKWAINKHRLINTKFNDHFNGKKIIQKQIETGVKKNKVGLQSISQSILRPYMKILNYNKNEVGYITSGGFSPSLKFSIAIGYIESSYNEDNIFCLIREKIEKVNIVKLPFISHKYKRGNNNE